MKKYQVIFCQGAYTCVDAECDTYDNACEREVELTAQMHMCGEHDFHYIIKEVER
jgi:hypothetical protein